MMPNKDAEKERATRRAWAARKRKRLHDEKYGPGAPDQRGRQGQQPKGANHPRWNNQLVTSHGYILVRVEKDHPLHVANGYAYEHRVVASEKLGRWLTSDEIVHHINGDKTDNRPENIEVLDRGAHNHLHLVEDDRRDAMTGRFANKRPYDDAPGVLR